MPSGVMTGIWPRSITQLICGVSTLITFRRRSRSSIGSPVSWLRVVIFLARRMSLPDMGAGLAPQAASCLTRLGLMSRCITSSTTLMLFSQVYRRPLMKCDSICRFFISAVMALPPPWTTIGRMPADAMKAMSWRTDRVISGSSMALPPNLTRTTDLAKSWMYGKASMRTEALAMRCCIDDTLLVLIRKDVEGKQPFNVY